MAGDYQSSASGPGDGVDIKITFGLQAGFNFGDVLSAGVNVVRAVLHDSNEKPKNDGRRVVENSANFNILGLVGYGIGQQSRIGMGEGSSGYYWTSEESYGGITYTTDHFPGENVTTATHTLFEFSFLIGIEIKQKQ
jgi:hypothetical protein